MLWHMLDMDLYRGSKSKPSQKGVRTHPAYSEAVQRQYIIQYHSITQNIQLE